VRGTHSLCTQTRLARTRRAAEIPVGARGSHSISGPASRGLPSRTGETRLGSNQTANAVPDKAVVRVNAGEPFPVTPRLVRRPVPAGPPAHQHQARPPTGARACTEPGDPTNRVAARPPVN